MLTQIAVGIHARGEPIEQLQFAFEVTARSVADLRSRIRALLDLVFNGLDTPAR